MLGKLIKHEFRATGRVMLPLYIALIVLAFFGNLSIRMLDVSKSAVVNIFASLILFVFGVAVFAVVIMSVIIMAQRFYRNLLSSEGYLMFTLPTSVHSLVWSKIIVSSVWFFATFAAIALSGLIVSFRLVHVNSFIEGLRDFFSQLTSYYALNGAAVVIEAIIVMFLGCAAMCLLFYASMAVGNGFSNHKILLSVVFFFVFQFAGQFLGLINIPWIEAIDIPTDMSAMAVVHTFMGSIAAAEIIYGAVFYVITALSLKKRLNLQ